MDMNLRSLRPLKPRRKGGIFGGYAPEPPPKGITLMLMGIGPQETIKTQSYMLGVFVLLHNPENKGVPLELTITGFDGKNNGKGHINDGKNDQHGNANQNERQHSSNNRKYIKSYLIIKSFFTMKVDKLRIIFM